MDSSPVVRVKLHQQCHIGKRALGRWFSSVSPGALEKDHLARLPFGLTGIWRNFGGRTSKGFLRPIDLISAKAIESVRAAQTSLKHSSEAKVLLKSATDQ